MKKMFIIDVPEDCSSDEWCVDGNLMYKNENGYWVVDHEIVEVELMPLPMKRETHVYWNSVGIGSIPTHEISDYDKGWNDCVEFLEGEEYADK